MSSSNGNGIVVGDGTLGVTSLTMTLSVADGTLELSQTTGLTFEDGSSNGSAAMTFSGPIDDINAALEGLVYTPNSGFTGNDSLVLSIADNQNTADGEVAIGVANAPSVAVPGPQMTNIGSALVFSDETGNSVSVADSGPSTTELTVTLSVADGLLDLSQTTGLTFADGGNDSSTLTFTGTAADINAALDGLTYTPDDGFDGGDTLYVTVDDPTTLATGQNQEFASVEISVGSVPGVTAPGAQKIGLSDSLTFSSVDSNIISVSDTGSSSTVLTVTLSVTNGTLTLATTSGITFESGSTNVAASMTFSGTAATVNGALDGLLYSPTADYAGDDMLNISAGDPTSLETGQNTATASVAITVGTAPSVAAPGDQTTNIDEALVFSADNSNPITVSDTGPSTTPLTVTLTVSEGTLNLSTVAGITFAEGSSNDAATMTFSGTAGDINAALAGLTYTPGSGFDGDDELDISVDDPTTLATGENQATASLQINVNSLPGVVAPSDLATPVNEPLTFSTADSTAITVSDTAASDTVLTVTIYVTDGTLNLARTSGITFVEGGNDQDFMTINGTSEDINTALNGLVYTPNTDFIGSDELSISVDDADTLTNDEGTATANVNIAVGSSPSIDAPASQVTGVDEDLTFAADNANTIVISDSGPSTTEITVTLAVQHGTISLSETDGLTFSDGSGNDAGDMTFTGLVSAVNAALGG